MNNLLNPSPRNIEKIRARHKYNVYKKNLLSSFINVFYHMKYPIYFAFPIIFPLSLSLKIVELFGT